LKLAPTLVLTLITSLAAASAQTSPVRLSAWYWLNSAPEPAPYLLTGQFPEKFLWDRPEVHQALAAYMKGLNNLK
jgi:hypothetical protein